MNALCCLAGMLLKCVLIVYIWPEKGVNRVFLQLKWVIHPHPTPTTTTTKIKILVNFGAEIARKVPKKLHTRLNGVNTKKSLPYVLTE